MTEVESMWVCVKKPLNKFRWLVKKDGSKILQQLYELKSLKEQVTEWRDVEEVSETENEE